MWEVLLMDCSADTPPLLFVGVLRRLSRKLGVALSAPDLGFRLNLTLEISALRTCPFVATCDQLHGFSDLCFRVHATIKTRLGIPPLRSLRRGIVSRRDIRPN